MEASKAKISSKLSKKPLCKASRAVPTSLKLYRDQKVHQKCMEFMASPWFRRGSCRFRPLIGSNRLQKPGLELAIAGLRHEVGSREGHVEVQGRQERVAAGVGRLHHEVVHVGVAMDAHACAWKRHLRSREAPGKAGYPARFHASSMVFHCFSMHFSASPPYSGPISTRPKGPRRDPHRSPRRCQKHAASAASRRTPSPTATRATAPWRPPCPPSHRKAPSKGLADGPPPGPELSKPKKKTWPRKAKIDEKPLNTLKRMKH